MTFEVSYLGQNDLKQSKIYKNKKIKKEKKAYSLHK